MIITFASDISFHYSNGFAGEKAAQAAMAEPAAVLAQADYSVVNLENIFGDKESHTPILKSGPNLITEERFVSYIHALKPTVVGLANNHSKDYGEEAMFQTIALLTDSGYMCIGAGKNIEEAYQPAKLEKDGIRVAIIAVCENEFGVATSKTSGTAGYSLGRVAKAIWQAREEGYKPVIYFHGGNEKNPFPSPGKVELYRHFVDLGAQAVVAMHTHCPQGYEIYEGKPIIYSMGNFFFPANVKEQSWYYGYMTQLEFTEETVNLAIHPYRFDYEGVKMLSGEDIAYFTRYMQVLCEPIGNEDALQELFDSWHYIGGYIHGFDWFEPHYIADGWSRQVKDMKNIFNCEAHNELVRNTFNMVFEGRMEKAKGKVEFIQKLQNMQID